MTIETARKALVSGLLMVGVLAAIGCSRQEPANQSTPAAQANAPAPASVQSTEITLKTNPDPAKAGENTFEVMVMQDGKPVTDATVSVELYMAAMPQMKMPEMKNTVDLTHAGDGVYRGTGQVMMAGNWDATVMAMRGGQELGTKKVALTAK